MIRGHPFIMFAKFSGFWTPSPPCSQSGFIYKTKFTQPPLMHSHFDLIFRPPSPLCERNKWIAPYEWTGARLSPGGWQKMRNMHGCTVYLLTPPRLATNITMLNPDCRCHKSKPCRMMQTVSIAIPNIDSLGEVLMIFRAVLFAPTLALFIRSLPTRAGSCIMLRMWCGDIAFLPLLSVPH